MLEVANLPSGLSSDGSGGGNSPAGEGGTRGASKAYRSELITLNYLFPIITSIYLKYSISLYSYT
jgi:hypothetical protein